METKFCERCTKLTKKIVRGFCIYDVFRRQTIQLAGECCFAESRNNITLHLDILSGGSVVLTLNAGIIGDMVNRFSRLLSIDEIFQSDQLPNSHVPIVLFVLKDKEEEG